MQAALIVVVTFTCALRGQVPSQPRIVSELSTARSYGNYAAEGSTADARGFPAGHVLRGGFTTVVAATDNTAAETVLGWETTERGVVAATVSEQATGWALNGAMEIGTMSSASGRSNEGPHDLRMIIRGTAGMRGKIELWAMGFVGGAARTSITIDIGDDGIPDFAHASSTTLLFERRQWDANLGPTGRLDVLIRTEGRAVAAQSQRATYFSGITVRFTPGMFCDIARYGSTCGPSLTGYDTIDARGAMDLVFDLQTAPASSPGVLVIGSRASSVPIPGTGCLLLTDPAVMLPFTTDALGEVSVVVRLPRLATPLQLRFQDVVDGGQGAISSNGVVVTCRQ